jgi:hypothetical protein
MVKPRFGAAAGKELANMHLLDTTLLLLPEIGSHDISEMVMRDKPKRL